MKLRILSEGIDWSQWSDKQLDAAAALGLGPKYKPTPRKTQICDKCGENAAYVREIHADTDMNGFELYCPKCGHSKER